MSHGAHICDPWCMATHCSTVQASHPTTIVLSFTTWPHATSSPHGPKACHQLHQPRLLVICPISKQYQHSIFQLKHSTQLIIAQWLQGAICMWVSCIFDGICESNTRVKSPAPHPNIVYLVRRSGTGHRAVAAGRDLSVNSVRGKCLLTTLDAAQGHREIRRQPHRWHTPTSRVSGTISNHISPTSARTP